MLRQIALDTETTGLDVLQQHRIIEIGCVELIDRQLTGNNFHTYLNPDREMDKDTYKIHGISQEFLQDKPRFSEIYQQLLAFIDQAELIIHNAAFDLTFLHAELKAVQWYKSITTSCAVIDTLILARQKHPGHRNSLDALCKRYHVDNTKRQLHGALIDAKILVYVYLAMTGGQISLFDDSYTTGSADLENNCLTKIALCSHSPIIFADAHELANHNEFIDFIIKQSKIDHFGVMTIN